MQKRLLVPSRVRQIPRQFSWVDHRLVRDHHIEHCKPPALALYLFLITVADAKKGLSYYAKERDGALRGLEWPINWLGERDSNPHWRSQSPQSYH